MRERVKKCVRESESESESEGVRESGVVATSPKEAVGDAPKAKLEAVEVRVTVREVEVHYLTPLFPPSHQISPSVSLRLSPDLPPPAHSHQN